MTAEEYPDPDNMPCGYYYRRVIDKQLKPADVFTVNFDTFDNNQSQECFLNLYNGEKKLSDATQKPVPLKRIGEQGVGMSCTEDNRISVPEGLDYQILTIQWVWRVNQQNYYYCADLYVKEGTIQQKFYSREAAQKWLDEISKFGLTRQLRRRHQLRSSMGLRDWLRLVTGRSHHLVPLLLL